MSDTLATGRPADARERTWRTELGKAIAKLSRTLTADVIGSGPLAQLRRMDPFDIPPPVFWTTLQRDAGVDEPWPKLEAGWAMVIQTMAILEKCHKPGLKPGTILAESGYPEGRFVRLLRAEGKGLAQELRTVARWARSKALKFDMVPLAAFVIARAIGDEVEADRASRSLARNFFSHRTQKSATPSAGDAA